MFDKGLVLSAGEQDKFGGKRLGQGGQISLSKPGWQAQIKELTDMPISPDRQ
jgi:hypothetical protein